MRIVVLTTWFPTRRNSGAGSFNARDVAALAKDHDVRVVHLVPPELDDGVRSRTVDGVPVEALPIDVRTPAGLLAAARTVPALLHGADIVHTMAAPALLAFLLRRPRVPWVHTEHWSGVANLTGSSRARLALPLSRRAFRGPDVVVAVSDHLADEVRRLRPRGVEVVGNIVDLGEPDDAVDTQLFRGAALKVLGVGSLKEQKGWRLAVEAVRLMVDRGEDVELLWLGGGPQADQLASLADDVTVHAPGHVPASVVRTAMAQADVFVLPTESETFSLVTVEALGAGLPVVVTGRGAHTSFLGPGAGIAVERDAESIAQGIAEARSFDRDVVAARGRELAARFDENAFRRSYGRIYEEVTR